MRFIVKYPDDRTGGIILFGVVMIIGIAELLLIRKAYIAKIPSNVKNSQSQNDSNARLCRQFGGQWEGGCCSRPKRSLPRGVPKCSR